MLEVDLIFEVIKSTSNIVFLFIYRFFRFTLHFFLFITLRLALIERCHYLCTIIYRK